MKSNKAILFDWGGVIELPVHTKPVYSYHDMHAEAVRTVFPQLTNRSSEELFNDLYEGAWWLASEKSLQVMIDYFADRLQHMKLDPKQAELYLDAVISVSHKVSFSQQVVDYLYNLNKRCTAGVLSDLALIDIPRIKAQINQAYVDKYYLSCEIGKSKWNGKIFRYVTDDLGVKPDNILFIDDKTRNVEQAREHGWNSFQATAFDLDFIRSMCEDFLDEEVYE